MPLYQISEEELGKFKEIVDKGLSIGDLLGKFLNLESISPEEDQGKLSIHEKRLDETRAEHLMQSFKEGYNGLVEVYKAMLQLIKEANERLKAVIDKVVI